MSSVCRASDLVFIVSCLPCLDYMPMLIANFIFLNNNNNNNNKTSQCFLTLFSVFIFHFLPNFFFPDCTFFIYRVFMFFLCIIYQFVL